jgi:hypothetical protein
MEKVDQRHATQWFDAGWGGEEWFDIGGASPPPP